VEGGILSKAIDGSTSNIHIKENVHRWTYIYHFQQFSCSNLLISAPCASLNSLIPYNQPLH
jgi:hypothetical protein